MSARKQPDRLRAFLGRTVYESYVGEDIMENLLKAGVPAAEVRKTKVRKWARREANRVNRVVTDAQIAGIPIPPEAMQVDVLEAPLTQETKDLLARLYPVR